MLARASVGRRHQQWAWRIWLFRWRCRLFHFRRWYVPPAPNGGEAIRRGVQLRCPVADCKLTWWFPQSIPGPVGKTPA